MKTKKDIGPVFKEALKSYKSSPDNSVWESLEANLKAGKKRRRTIIIWFIGALIALIPLFFIVDHFTAPVSDLEKIETPSRDASKDKKEPIDSENNNPKPIINQKEDNPFPKSNSLTRGNPVKKKKQSKPILSNTSQKKKETPILADISKSKTIVNDTISGNTLKDKNSLNIKKEPTGELEKKQPDKKKKKKKKRKLSSNRAIAKKQQSQQSWAWKIYPFASLDHYNAFKLKTSNQYTFNYGFRLNFYTINNTALRIGVKNLGLQYDFTSNNGISSQQRVRYIEIPLEAKYLFTTEKFINPSFIGGVSYLYLQEATLTTPTQNVNNKEDFINNIISFNVGLGLQKDLGKNFSLNVEGFFKYQYRTYSKTVGFSPYTFSIHTGIEYHF